MLLLAFLWAPTFGYHDREAVKIDSGSQAAGSWIDPSTDMKSWNDEQGDSVGEDRWERTDVKRMSVLKKKVRYASTAGTSASGTSIAPA